MQTTLKRIDIGSAFRVGAIVYLLLFAIFGLLFVVFQGVFLSAITRAITINTPNNANVLIGSGFGILSLLCFYGVGIVVAAVFGGIQVTVAAFCYNLAANWVGGLRFTLQTDDTGLLDAIERDARPSG